MPFDTDRYRSLISRAAFDCSFYKGTWADQSRNRLAMTAVGTPSWTMVNGLPALDKTDTFGASGTTSAAVASIVDITGTVTFEALYIYSRTYHPVVLRQRGAAGGFYWGAVSGVDRAELVLYDAAGAIARYVTPATGSLRRNRPNHILITSIAGGTSGLIWIGGVPSAVTPIGAGVAANSAAQAVVVGGAASDAGTFVVSRAYPFAFTNEDAAAAYGAAHAMFPEV